MNNYFNKLKNKKKVIYLIVMAIFVLLWIFSNKIISMISSGQFQLESVNESELSLGSPVYYGLDTVELYNDLPEKISIIGWAFCETDSENADKENGILLKAENRIFKIKGETMIRRDIRTLYAKNNYKIAGNNHGFNMSFSTVGLKDGIYELYIYNKENDTDKGTIPTGIKFLKEKGALSRLNNYALQNFSPQVTNIEDIRFEIDRIYSRNGNCTIDGWGILKNIDCISTKVYIELIDSDNNRKIFEAYKRVRKDIAEGYRTPKYLYSGIKCSIPLTEFDDGDIQINLILENGEYYSNAAEVKRYAYNDELNTFKTLK